MALLTQVLHPSSKDSRHHTGLQTNVTGVSLPCVSVVRSTIASSQVETDRQHGQEDAVNIEELSLGGDILKMLVLSLALSLELRLIQPLKPLHCVCRDVSTVNNVSSSQAGAKENTSSFIRPAEWEHNW